MRTTWIARLLAGLLLASLAPMLGADLSSAVASPAPDRATNEAAGADSMGALPAPAHRLLQVVAATGAATSTGGAPAVLPVQPAPVRLVQAVPPSSAGGAVIHVVRPWRLVTLAEPMGP